MQAVLDIISEEQYDISTQNTFNNLTTHAAAGSVEVGIEKKLYISEKLGSDESGDGTINKPFKTVFHIVDDWKRGIPIPAIYIKKDKWELMSNTAAKKLIKIFIINARKLKKQKMEEEEACRTAYV